jgi:DNA repair exonuclease SbcCD ATPase subunit
MIQDRLDKIEERLKQSKTVKESDKAELLTLLTTLRTEIADLSQTHHEHAESIAGFAELSTHEATRSEKSPELFNLSIEGLTSSVQGFEESHPRLVGIINTFCTMLSNLGI